MSLVSLCYVRSFSAHIDVQQHSFASLFSPLFTKDTFHIRHLATTLEEPNNFTMKFPRTVREKSDLIKQNSSVQREPVLRFRSSTSVLPDQNMTYVIVTWWWHSSLRHEQACLLLLKSEWRGKNYSLSIKQGRFNCPTRILKKILFIE